jgi:hypothetical protein
MASSEIILTEKVENTERKFGEALEYFPSKVVREDGSKTWAMFTEAEIETAIDRAMKNKEDIPKSLWDSIFG